MESSTDEEIIDSDTEISHMPTLFGKITNLATSTKVAEWTDSDSDDEVEDVVVKIVESAKKHREEEDEVQNEVQKGDVEKSVVLDPKTEREQKVNGPFTVPKGGKGSYRELCKTDFARAAWLAGKKGAKQEKGDDGKELSEKDAYQKLRRQGLKGGNTNGKIGDGIKKSNASTKKGGLKRPRGKRGGKKNKKGGNGNNGRVHNKKMKKF